MESTNETVELAFGHDAREAYPFPVACPYDADRYARSLDAQSPRAIVSREEWEAYQRHLAEAEAWKQRWAFLAYGPREGGAK